MENPTEKAAEHVIAYAYPTSENAIRHGHGKSGCYTLAANGTEQPLNTYDQAILAATSLRTIPGRWSMDHPLNCFPH